MGKRTLTDTFIRALRPAPAGKRAEFWDLRVPGFGIRVTARGTKTFVLYTRLPTTRLPARLKLGDASKMGLAAAREKAKAWLDLIEQGKDPREVAEAARLAEQRALRVTFGVVVEDWLREVVRGRQRQARAVENDVRRGLLSHWGNRPITEITARDVRDVIGKVKVHAPASAHNLLGHAKRLFAWAVEQDYGLAESPATSLRPKKLIGAKVTRNRVLDDTELRAMWRAAGTLGYPYGPIFKLLALTGQRKSEVARARWREIDLHKKVWLIPAERMKGGAAHLVPLVDDALAIMAELPEFGKGDHLFSTTFGSKAVGGFGRAKKRLDAAMATELGRPIDPYVVHDIRRSVRTNLSALPITDKVRELVIAHAQPGLHKTYDLHSYRDEKYQALELWAARLRKIVSLPPTAEVVDHPARGRKGSTT
jgi:integrase